MEYLWYLVPIVWCAAWYYLFKKVQSSRFKDISNALVCTFSAVGCFYYIFDSFKDSLIMAVGMWLLGEPREYLASKGITMQKFINWAAQRIKIGRDKT